MSSLAITASAPTDFNAGVSVNMSIDYMKSAQLGDTVVIESSCIKRGKNLVFTETKLYCNKDLIASGTHTKFCSPRTKVTAKL